jgi:hypothetical protein
MKIAANYISKNSTYKWAEAFLKDLKRSHQPCDGGSSTLTTAELNKALLTTGG